MNNNETTKVRQPRRTCVACKRRKAVWVIHSAYVTAANRKHVCNNPVCWGAVTLGYPAAGRRVA